MIDFDGANDQIDYTNVFDPAAVAKTISAWVRPDDLTSGNFRIFSIEDSGGSFFRVSLMLRAPGNVAIQEPIYGGNTLIAVSSTTLSINTLYHVLATHTGSILSSSMAIWIDGIEESSYGAGTQNGTGSKNANADGAWSIGSRVIDGIQRFDGEIGNFAIWDRVLAPEEIRIVASGYSPLYVPRGLRFAPHLVRDFRDPVTGQVGTEVGSVVVTPHIRTIMRPSGFIVPTPLTEVTLTHTTDALLQAVKTKAHTTDAQLQLIRPSTHTTDALIKQVTAGQIGSLIRGQNKLGTVGGQRRSTSVESGKQGTLIPH